MPPWRCSRTATRRTFFWIVAWTAKNWWPRGKEKNETQTDVSPRSKKNSMTDLGYDNPAQFNPSKEELMQQIARLQGQLAASSKGEEAGGSRAASPRRSSRGRQAAQGAGPREPRPRSVRGVRYESKCAGADEAACRPPCSWSKYATPRDGRTGYCTSRGGAVTQHWSPEQEKQYLELRRAGRRPPSARQVVSPGATGHFRAQQVRGGGKGQALRWKDVAYPEENEQDWAAALDRLENQNYSPTPARRR